MSVAENFDYSIPFSSRKDLMSLDTIQQRDAKIHPFKKMDTQRNWSANLFNRDIEKSYPKKAYNFTNKVDYINKVDDIYKSNPKVLHFGLNRPEFNLSNNDIEKSKPNSGHMKTNRCTNPLQPKYHLPQVEEYPVPEPKFLRDQINISDIKGAKPKPYFKFKSRETFPLDNFNIEGSKPKKTYVRTTVYNNIDYSDLTKDIFKTSRHTNPLDPVYEFKKKDGAVEVHGLIEKSKPQTIYPYTHPVPYGLKIDDIIGAQAGTKNRINKFNGQNFELTTKDIKGCNTGSLKKGIVTQRNTNPLCPKYQYLGRKELKNIDNDPFGKTAVKFHNKNKLQNLNDNEKNNTRKVPMSARPGKQIESKEIQTHDLRIGEGENNEIFHDPIPRPNYMSNTMENFTANPMPDPYYGLIHDRYVCPSSNPGIKKEIDKAKEDYFVTKAAEMYANGEKNQIPNGNDNGEYRQSSSSVGVKTRSNMPRACVSAFGPRCLSNAQKLDNFMATHGLKYIGEEVKLKN